MASAALGAQDFEEQVGLLKQLALRILDGADYRKIPRFADENDPRDAVGQEQELKHDGELEKRELDWLRSKGKAHQ